MIAVDLFSGIGMQAAGLALAGFNVAALCEIDPWRRDRASELHPSAELLDDVTKEETADAVGRLQPWLISGSPPCQPFSRAGARRRTQDERDLWPAMLRIVGAARPARVLVENVAGLDDGADGLDRIQDDLGDLGYWSAALEMPAAGVGAPHLRYRWFIIGCLGDGNGFREREPEGCVGELGRRPADPSSVNAGAMGDRDGAGPPDGDLRARPTRGQAAERASRDDIRPVGNTERDHAKLQRGPRSVLRASSSNESRIEQPRWPAIGCTGEDDDPWRDWQPVIRHEPADPKVSRAPSGVPLVAHGGRQAGIPDRARWVAALGDGVCVPLVERIGRAILTEERAGC